MVVVVLLIATVVISVAWPVLFVVIDILIVILMAVFEVASTVTAVGVLVVTLVIAVVVVVLIVPCALLLVLVPMLAVLLFLAAVVLLVVLYVALSIVCVFLCFAYLLYPIVGVIACGFFLRDLRASSMPLSTVFTAAFDFKKSLEATYSLHFYALILAIVGWLLLIFGIGLLPMAASIMVSAIALIVQLNCRRPRKEGPPPALAVVS